MPETYPHKPMVAFIVFKDVPIEAKQLQLLTAEVKKVNNVLSLVISWNLNGLDHAIIRIKKAVDKGNITVDWSTIDVLTNIEVGSGKTSAVFQNPIAGYKYLIEGIGVNAAGILSQEEYRPKIEIYCDTIYEPDPIIPDGTPKEQLSVITPRRLKYFYEKMSAIFEQKIKEEVNARIAEIKKNESTL